MYINIIIIVFYSNLLPDDPHYTNYAELYTENLLQ